jgi:hypothetical protein
MSDLIIATAGMFIISGIIQLFLQTISLRRDKRGRLLVEFGLRRWSLRSTYPGAIMIATGALLLAIWPLVTSKMNDHQSFSTHTRFSDARGRTAPNGGVAGSLDEAAFRTTWDASLFTIW